MSPTPPERPTEFGPSEVLGEEPPPRRLSRPLVVLTTAALVVLGGVGVATAAAAGADSPSPSASSSPSATPSPTATSRSDSDVGRGKGWGWRHRPYGLHGAIHGEYVVPDGNGGYRTIATQRGEVTAVDQDSITVKSEDGFSREYAVTGETRVGGVNRDGISAVKTGAQVHVTAQVDGQTATALTVVDLSGVRERWQKRERDDKGPHGGRRHEDRGRFPAPEDRPIPGVPHEGPSPVTPGTDQEPPAPDAGASPASI